MNKQKINSNILNEMTKELEKKKTIELCDGKYSVEIYESFRETTINNIVTMFASLINKLNNSSSSNKKQKSKISESKIATEIVSLQPACILFYLTDLYFPNPETDLQKFLRAYEVYLDMGIVTEIMDQVSDKDMEKLRIKLEQFAKNFKTLSQQTIKNEMENNG